MCIALSLSRGLQPFASLSVLLLDLSLSLVSVLRTSQWKPFEYLWVWECVGEWMWELLCQVIPHTEIYIPSYLKYLERRLNWRKENNSFGTCESATSRQNQTRMFIHTRTFVERKIYSSATSKPSEWVKENENRDKWQPQPNEWAREWIEIHTEREKKSLKWNNKSLKYLQYRISQSE